MIAESYELLDNPNYSFDTKIDGVSFKFTLQANDRTKSFFLTVELRDGTVVLASKELAPSRQLFFNSNSPIVASVVLVKSSEGTFPNYRNNHFLMVIY